MNNLVVYSKVKRILDFIFSLIAILLLWPFFLIIALLIKIDSMGPVFFKQMRIGKDKKEFFIFKFRTMRTDTPKDIPTHMMESPDRFITRIGRFLRRTSLDELPQIINILKGELSFIGPRPALWNQFDLITERDKYGVNSIYPGLTGWAQISGRDKLSIKVKARFDGEYVKRIGLKMDVKCFFRTILSILRSDGVVEGGAGSSTRKEGATAK
ncbi:sugar transferase [Actinomycetota bacterium]